MAAIANEAARRTALYVANMRRAGHATKPRRVARPRPPLDLERAYATQLVAIVHTLRSQVQHALGGLSGLIDVARAARGDAAERMRRRIGLDIHVENAAGSMRTWTDASGAEGATKMRWDYGEILGHVGADGDPPDVFLGPVADPLLVFVIHQRSARSSFANYDEDKVMLGWDSADAARAAYLEHYDDPRFFGGMSSFTVEDFKRRLTASPGRAIVHETAGREIRADVGEGRKARALFDRVRESGSISRASHQAERASDAIARKVGIRGREQLAVQSKAALGVDVAPLLVDKGMQARIEHFAHENAALIKSLGNRTIDDIEKMVTGAFARGARHEDLAKEIEARFGIAERHARMIARDQIAKLNAQVTRARHQELGIGRFTWITANDNRVRSHHASKNNKVWAYKAEYGPVPSFFPGQEVCCRCGEVPVFDDIMAMVDAILAGGPSSAPAAPVRAAASVPNGPPPPAAPPAAPPPGPPPPPAPPPGGGAPPSGSGSSSGSQPPPPSSAGSGRPSLASTPAGHRELRQRAIVSTRNLGGGQNTTELATFDDGSLGVWKPVAGERPGLRSNIRVGTYHVREAAASRVAEQLGVSDLLPATEARVHAGAKGSLQSYVSNVRQAGMPGVPPFSRDSSERMRVFDFVTGNTDRHSGNAPQVTRGRKSLPVLIDHGLAFPSGPPEQFCQPWAAIARAKGPLLPGTLGQIAKIDPATLARTLLDSGLDETAVTHTLYRARLLQLHPGLLEVPQMKVGQAGHDFVWDNTATNAHVMLDPAERSAMEAIVAAAQRRTP